MCNLVTQHVWDARSVELKKIVGSVKKLKPYNYIFFASEIYKSLHANL